MSVQNDFLDMSVHNDRVDMSVHNAFVDMSAHAAFVDMSVHKVLSQLAGVKKSTKGFLTTKLRHSPLAVRFKDVGRAVHPFLHVLYSHGLNSYGLHDYGLYSYGFKDLGRAVHPLPHGLYRHGLNSYGLHEHDLYSYGLKHVGRVVHRFFKCTPPANAGGRRVLRPVFVFFSSALFQKSDPLGRYAQEGAARPQEEGRRPRRSHRQVRALAGPHARTCATRARRACAYPRTQLWHISYGLLVMAY